ncbi:preprotein translocase subunit SecG [Erythrobacter crassostreae]|uniref:Protein-export membrane protein SecG n=1 Tax=Erythrobacter crassostreae TaxID=2828328 RepID=A0A9X1F4U0_9SPHN|nr:preprotein translocase subunit SecG [Erythrobacter crassostrea]MBV7260247.1 preprotein translocase subunit SecG [Erythrobacter crassostrea]
MFLFLTVLQAIVAAGLVAVVLMQRSEGGGLGIGGNPNGALGARGAADFLTRATKWLAVAFVALSIALAAVAVNETSSGSISTTLDRDVSAPTTDDLLGGPAGGEAADQVDGQADGQSDDPATD